MRWSEVGNSACTLARALSAVGDRWTLLVLREAFLGVRRYEDFQRQTGAAPKLVSDRLAKLVRHGMLERRRYQERPARDEYRLTDKGRDFYPVMVTLSQWGQRWMGDPERPPVTLVHKGCGRPMAPALVCPECGEAVGPGDSTMRIDPAYAAERAGRAAAP
ncbi:MAG: helix-turn-helix transcriptional regulator [Alphaproteobacteria bacterium]|nr:helix-turn-helix transcriptional regulator [Alphaproteobacteria bacterium]